ncbi:unnamed protein product, partial [Adineta steineri]
MYYFIRYTTLFILVCSFYQTDNFLLTNRISKIKIGSFNLRRYSLTKATSTNSVNLHISKILKRYDLVFLQEIIDASNDNRVINHLLNHLHK